MAIIEYDTDAGTISTDGIDPIEVKDVMEAIQVIEAIATEMDSSETELPEDIDTGMDEQEQEAEAMAAEYDGKKIKKRGMAEKY